MTSINEEELQAVLDAATDEASRGKRLARLQRRKVLTMDEEADALSLSGDEKRAAAVRSKAKAVRNGVWSPSGGRTVRNPGQFCRSGSAQAIGVAWDAPLTASRV